MDVRGEVQSVGNESDVREELSEGDQSDTINGERDDMPNIVDTRPLAQSTPRQTRKPQTRVKRVGKLAKLRRELTMDHVIPKHPFMRLVKRFCKRGGQE